MNRVNEIAQRYRVRWGHGKGQSLGNTNIK